tara:strand:- start:760 stop:1386 length:627 start_codon:yes stop_codon:yes gene_type:complete
MPKNTIKDFIRKEIEIGLKEGKDIATIEEDLLDRVRARIAGAGAFAKTLGKNLATIPGSFIYGGDEANKRKKNVFLAYKQRKADSMIKAYVKKIISLHKELEEDLEKTGLELQGESGLKMAMALLTQSASEERVEDIVKIRGETGTLTSKAQKKYDKEKEEKEAAEKQAEEEYRKKSSLSPSDNLDLDAIVAETLAEEIVKRLNKQNG